MTLELQGIASFSGHRQCRASWRSARVQGAGPNRSPRDSAVPSRVPTRVPTCELLARRVGQQPCSCYAPFRECPAIRAALGLAATHGRGSNPDPIIRSDAISADRRDPDEPPVRRGFPSASRRGDSNPDPVITRFLSSCEPAWLTQNLSRYGLRVPRVCQSVRRRRRSEALGVTPRVSPSLNRVVRVVERLERKPRAAPALTACCWSSLASLINGASRRDPPPTPRKHSAEAPLAQCIWTVQVVNRNDRRSASNIRRSGRRCSRCLMRTG